MPVGTGSIWVFDEYVIGAALTPLEGQPPLVVNSHMPGTVVFLKIVPRRRLHETHRRRFLQDGDARVALGSDVNFSTSALFSARNLSIVLLAARDAGVALARLSRPLYTV